MYKNVVELLIFLSNIESSTIVLCAHLVHVCANRISQNVEAWYKIIEIIDYQVTFLSELLFRKG